LAGGEAELLLKVDAGVFDELTAHVDGLSVDAPDAHDLHALNVG
jgi:hypothetical protein